MEQMELDFQEERPVFSVSEIVLSVKEKLESQFRDLWVKGEISNFRRPSSGHFYFTLKDSDAQLRAVCFRLQNRLLKFTPEDGMDVIARGSLSVYPPRGEFQLVVEVMEPLGRGALQLAFEQLKERLRKEGLFDAVHKKPLPLFPSRIGVVTSPTGAALRDMLRVLKRRNDRLHVLIAPVRVQGEGASSEIARAIRMLAGRGGIDVIVVTRGGGSLEDLWAFNEEEVARAIFDSPIPVISAVGHEIDFTISDFVADLRSPTPSAAAEIVSAARTELVDRVEGLRRRAVQAASLLLQRRRAEVSRLSSHRVFAEAENKLRFFLQRVDELQARLEKTVSLLIPPRRQELEMGLKGMRTQMRFFLQTRRQSLQGISRQLEAFSPGAVLRRGYAIVTTPDGQVVRDPAQVAMDGDFRVRVSEGQFSGRRVKDDGI